MGWAGEQSPGAPSAGVPRSRQKKNNNNLRELHVWAVNCTKIGNRGRKGRGGKDAKEQGETKRGKEGWEGEGGEGVERGR